MRLTPQKGGALGITLGPPLSRRERTRAGRSRLIGKDFGPLRPGVFFESFNGKSSGGNPRAILDALQGDTGAPLWWSVVDGTVPVPPGATPVVAGTEAWFSALRTSQVLITNNNFPHWFSKLPGQMVVQTWHGTPIKRLIHDAPPSFTPLVYRRLIRRQAGEWDLLLAQDGEAERRLRSALQYDGPVHLGEQPCNVRLAQGDRGRARVRNELGIPADDRVVLYAPTWRERMRRASGEESLRALMDPERLAAETGARVLVRSHHMNGLRAEGPGVIDVSAYPHVEDLMLASDVLVTDYSSIFFDYRLTGKPMLVHAPDLEWYRDVERGFYGRWPEDLGLLMSRNQDQIIDLVRTALDADQGPVHEVNSARESIAHLRGMIVDAMRGTVGSRTAQQDDKNL
ncbi:CDP-glycerol glycerophosphotransferase family protein [Ornithinicoccus hortensis]|uniref:CDP-glycerol glycerophosphotransferase (TagB/SpsB family) n=1 Tax=Ornithinicoccus hortensis TaxID=82346 RepID=A0A542YLI5_9MICO|nr:CDP-glycerol glycerophosphotransferase family protein [Ornithinicoccus hortensis]TQL48955.1 CDP-glycerol glycerophosphotransferase (TagB/SpsB family) [Ornithinicoccus hortensis]